MGWQLWYATRVHLWEPAEEHCEFMLAVHSSKMQRSTSVRRVLFIDCPICKLSEGALALIAIFLTRHKTYNNAVKYLTHKSVLVLPLSWPWRS